MSGSAASLLPPARANYYDQNGNPLRGGKVYTFVPGGTVTKTTWMDAGETKANSNPIILDANGSCLIYGSGAYQITVQDANGNSIPAYSGLSQTFVAPTVANPFPSVPTIAALRTYSGSATVIMVLGYAAPGDGGGGIFFLNTGDLTSPDNGGTIIIGVPAARWYRETQGTAVNVLWFGAKAGTTDNLGAMQAAVAVSHVLLFPPGKFQMSANWSINTASSGIDTIVMQGAGKGATILYWPAGGGLSINLNSGFRSCVSIQDMSFTTGTAGTGNPGLYLNGTTAVAAAAICAQSKLSNLDFRGDDGPAVVNYWSNCIKVVNVCNVNYTSIEFTGPAPGSTGYTAAGLGVELSGSASLNSYSVVHNFQTCIFNYVGVAINYDTFVQGVTVNQCNMTGGTNGIAAPATALGFDQLTVSNNQINVNGAGIILACAAPQLAITGNYFILPANSVAVQLQIAGQFTIIGNNFQGDGGANNAGIRVMLTTGPASTIVGNTFWQLTNGIFLNTTTNGVVVGQNGYANCTQNVDNIGGANLVGVATP